MSIMETVKAHPSYRRRNGSRRRVKGATREFAVHISYFISGVLISRGAMFGEMSPFGASFCAAIPFSYLPAGVLGSALSYLFLSPVDSFRYIAVVISVGTVRWILNEIKKISMNRFFPSAVAFLPVFATGLALTFSPRSEVTEVFECFVEGLLAAAGAYFMSRTVSLGYSRRSLTGFNQQELACIAMTGCILLLSFSTLTFGDVSVGRILAVLAVMIFARYGFVKGGSVAGIATGIVFALSDNNLLCLAGAYPLSGLVAGLMAPMGKIAVILTTLVCNGMMSFAADNSSLTVTIVIETLLAAGVFLLIPKEAGRFFSAAFSDDAVELSNEAIRRNVTMRLSHCSKALENVSSCVNSVSERLGRLYESNADWIYSRATEDTCRNCGLRVYCWEKEKALTSDDFHRLTPLLKENGFVKERDIEDNFLKRCCKCSELANSINRSYKEYLSMEAARRRVTQVRSVVAGQFAGLSDILHDLSEEFEEVDSFDTASSEKVIAALTEQGVVVMDCSCKQRSGRGMTVELELAVGKKTALSKAQLTHAVGKACGRYFSSPSMSFEGDRARVTLCELPLYDLEIGSAQHVCNNGELCGDCLNYFNNGEGSTVAIISDGMGSGGRAAVDSNMAVSIMTKLCKAGLSYDCSLSVVNSSLMIKSEEESLATMDLLDFNLFTGRARLMKAGACTTYIKKSSKLMKKDLPSLPLGILNESKFIKEDVSLSTEDMIVMVSDGVMIGSSEWLEKLIMTFREGSAEQLASAIVDEAYKRRRGDHDDDITAIALRVVENA